MIEFINVEKKYQTDFWTKPYLVLDKLSFKVSPGDMVGFLGANGAGKTTSIKALLQFIKIDKGQILYDPILGKDFQTALSKVGFLPERPYLYPHITGREFLHYMGGLNQIKKQDLNERIKKWSDRFEIAYALDRKIRAYSKGMLQRIGFVSALIHDPLFLVLDEPLSGLDPIGRRDFKQALISLHGEGKTIFFSSHIVSDVEEICSKVVFLEKGQLVYEGSIDRLIERSLQPHFLITIAEDKKIFFPGELCYTAPGGMKTYKVLPENKTKFLEQAIKENCPILSLNLSRPTLEEIIYKIKQ